MFDRERALNEFMIQYLEKLVSDIDEADLGLQPVEGMNPPRWILGHLAINTDYAMRMLGGRFLCPFDWHRSFLRGSQPLDRPDVNPSKDELMALICEGFSIVRQQCESADPTALNQPHAVPFLKETPIKTVGDVVAHLLTTHLATHVGQLSYWRRAIGRARVEPGTTPV